MENVTGTINIGFSIKSYPKKTCKHMKDIRWMDSFVDVKYILVTYKILLKEN